MTQTHWTEREWAESEKSTAYRRPSQDVRLERIAEAKERRGKFRIEDGIRQEYVDGVWIDRPWEDPAEMPNRVKEVKARKAQIKSNKNRRRGQKQRLMKSQTGKDKTRQIADRTQGHKGYE